MPVWMIPDGIVLYGAGCWMRSWCSGGGVPVRSPEHHPFAVSPVSLLCASEYPTLNQPARPGASKIVLAAGRPRGFPSRRSEFPNRLLMPSRRAFVLSTATGLGLIGSARSLGWRVVEPVSPAARLDILEAWHATTGASR
jgi:hypothetical protein